MCAARSFDLSRQARYSGNGTLAASGEADANLIQMGIGRLQIISRRFFTFASSGFELLESLDDRGDAVFTRSRAGDIATLELVWIDVTNERSQSFQMLAPRRSLIVLFNERDRHNRKF